MRFVPPALAGMLGLWQLGEPSLWVDEAFTARAVSDEAPPLGSELHAVYYAALRPWTEIFGTSEVALRVPSVIGAMLAAWLLYGLVRSLLGDERIAFASAVLLAINPFIVQWSQQARSYTFVVCLAIGTTWLLVARRWVAYVLCSVLLVYVQFFSAFLLLAVHVIVEWRDVRARRAWGLVFVCSLPWLVLMLGRGEEASPIDWLHPPGHAQLMEFATRVPGALGLGLLLALVGLRHTQHRAILGVWAFFPATITLAASVWKPIFLDRYLIVSAPAFAILASVALFAFAPRLRLAASAAVAIASLVALASWYAPANGDNWRGENWRAATQYVGGRARVEPPWAVPAFLYYGGTHDESGRRLVRGESLATTRVPFGRGLSVIP